MDNLFIAGMRLQYRKKKDTTIDEEYEKLFPPKEIEKPENKRGELVVQLCD